MVSSTSTNSSAPLILGVDAGGTKTTAWLARVRPSATAAPLPLRDAIEILGCASAGPGNPRAIGFEAATRAIGTAIQSAYSAAGRNVEPAAAACLAVAGAGRPEEQRQLQSWCEAQGFAQRLQIMGDAAPVLAAAQGHYPRQHLQSLRGIALISGTGSLAWGCHGRAADGQLRQARVGGWGYLLGDEGSGYWIATQGLRAACRAADGIGPSTRVLPALLQALELERPADLIETIYGQPLDRRRIAHLAPVVMGLAESDDSGGDSVAIEIIQRAAADLATMVRGVFHQLEFNVPGLPLALAGGVLVHGTPLRQQLEKILKPLELCPVVVESPVLGALYLAAALLDGDHCQTQPTSNLSPPVAPR